MRILVVDDAPDDRALAVRALRRDFPDAELVEAAEEPEISAALEAGVDLVITDYALRWTTGIDIIDRVAQRRPGVPVIMFTNTGSEEVAARALRHGAADYVIKRHGEFNRLATAAKNVLDQAQLRSRVEVLLAQEREARLEAERASRLRDEFLATLSHELRTPLHAILGWLDLLRMGALQGQELAKAYEVLDRNARAQARLIDDLLDLSRIASGNLAFQMELTPLGPLVDEVLQEMRPLAQSRSVALGPSADAYGGLVRGDAARLRQVVRNLVSNAVKFSPDGGTVSVSLERAGAMVQISVEDRGIGLESATIEQIFERFRQADGSTTRRAGGMGIGLSIAKHMVEAHGGEIGVQSAGPGKGALFWVKLPVPEILATPHAKQPGQVLPSLRGLRVVVIDDEPDALAMTARVLEMCEAAVACASNARDGYDLLGKHRPDVLVSDIGMPNEDGYSLIRRVREVAAFKVLPAIAVTAFAREEDREKALAAGFDAHLAKPVHAEVLIRCIASLAQRRG